jgi:multicomponent Na+:H+ antiporter subunit A
MGGLALLAPVLEWGLGRNAGYPLAAGFLAVAALLGVATPRVLTGEDVAASWPWLPGLGVSFSLRFDGLSALFCLLVLGVGALIMAYCPRYLPHGGRHGMIYFLLTLFGGAMLGLVLASDLVLLVVFWEMTTVISFFLIGTTGTTGAKPAVRALLVTGTGGLALLAAVVLLSVTVGSTDLDAVLAAREQVLGSALAPVIAGLIILAAFTKSGQVPFQFWLSGAMVAITPVSAYLHAATMVKAGIYLLLRFSTIYALRPGWTFVLVGVGLVTAVIGAAQALREHDLKALLAYSTVSQLGLLTAAIGVGTTVALAAAILHTFAHALFKATLFMLVGVIDREAGSRDIRRLSGLMRVMPVTAILTGVAGLSMAGVAPLIGFVSKESLFQGFASLGVAPGAGVLAAALAVTASALTFAYGARIFYGAFAGPTRQRLYEPSWLFLAPAAVAAAASVVLGPGVAVLNPLMRRAILDVEPWAQPPNFSLWHGWSPELLLSAVTITCGLGLFVARDRVDRVLARLPRLGGEALFDRCYGAVLRFGAVVGRPDHRDSVGVFVARPVAAVVLLAAAGAVAVSAALPVSGVVAGGAAGWVVVALLLGAAAAVARMSSTVGAVALLGAIGMLMTVWFLLAGAPDVALTLLLVEVLTAVVAAFVLRGLPPRFPVGTLRGALGAAGLALVAGVAAAAGTLALAGPRGLSPVGQFYVDNAAPLTGGRNVVNTVLVDFRGLDTLGEISVLAAAGLGLLLLLPSQRWGALPAPYGRLLGPAYRVLAPTTLTLSAYLLLSGHNTPGGGFIAALVAGAAAMLGLLSRVRGDVRTGWPPPSEPLLSGGLTVSVLVGLAAMIAGKAFLTPAKATVSLPLLGPVSLSTSLLFDVGVYLLVLGVMAAAVDRLGTDPADRR